MERQIYRCDICKEEFDNEEETGYNVHSTEIGSNFSVIQGHACPVIQGHVCQGCFEILFKDWKGERFDEEVLDEEVEETNEG